MQIVSGYSTRRDRRAEHFIRGEASPATVSSFICFSGPDTSLYERAKQPSSARNGKVKRLPIWEGSRGINALAYLDYSSVVKIKNGILTTAVNALVKNISVVNTAPGSKFTTLHFISNLRIDIIS